MTIIGLLLNLIIIICYVFMMVIGVIDEFSPGSPKSKFFFNIDGIEMLLMFLFMFLLPTLNMYLIINLYITKDLNNRSQSSLIH